MSCNYLPSFQQDPSFDSQTNFPQPPSAKRPPTVKLGCAAPEKQREKLEVKKTCAMIMCLHH